MIPLVLGSECCVVGRSLIMMMTPKGQYSVGGKRGGLRPGSGRPLGSKNKKPYKPNEARAHAKQQMIIAALALRRQGHSYQSIGNQLGCSDVEALRMVRGALARAEALVKEEAKEVIALELIRLDEMSKGISTSAEKGDPRLIETMLKIMDRRAHYLGLDAPAKQEVGGKDGPATFEIRIGKEFDGV
jgi:hypothetical protein